MRNNQTNGFTRISNMGFHASSSRPTFFSTKSLNNNNYEYTLYI